MKSEHLEDSNYIGGLTMSKEKHPFFKLESKTKKYNSYLIKRSPDLTNTGVLSKSNSTRKAYSESSTKTPSSVRLKVGDVIYVSETNYGIYAKGRVIEVKDGPEVFKSIEDIFKYFNKSKDGNYCFSLMKKLSKAQVKNQKAKLYYHEYFIDQTLLDRVISLTGELSELKNIQSAFSKIKDHLIQSVESPNIESYIEISSDIPGALRQRLYSFFNKKYKVSTWIDIDHFVPKSIGGPGNLIQNLVPIGFSLNRYKSNSIPKGLFHVAREYPELEFLVKNDFISEKQEMFLRKVSAKENAKRIIDIVNSWENENGLKKIKDFYGKVLEFHHPDYFEMIKKLEWVN